MTSDTPDTQENARTDAEPPDEVTETDSRLVVEFTVPTEAFVLEEALSAVPNRIVEFEQLVPTESKPLPYLWVTGTSAAFEEVAVADSTVDAIHRVATFSEDALYRIDWAASSANILEWIRSRDATILQSEGQNQEWLLKLRVESRETLEDLQTYCDDHEIDFHVVRLYDLEEPKMGQFNVTRKQREALITAEELGHFEIPRDATLEDVADALGISPKAASERLRRGQTNLVNNTLTIGQPTGVGLN